MEMKTTGGFYKINVLEKSSGDSQLSQGWISLFTSPTKVKDCVLDRLSSLDVHFMQL